MGSVRKTGLAAVASLALLWALPGPGLSAEESAPSRNGFSVSPASIPTEGILHGGPPRDGIPALTEPGRVPAAESPWPEDEMVIGVVRGEEARAYPLSILTWHELVNDTLGGEPILISYCPLCGSALVFDRRIGGFPRTFGVSGLLYRSDLLLYDRETESLWSQIKSEAVTGPALGSRLRVLRSALVAWGTWKREHPSTTVLSPETGYRRDYSSTPYRGYAQSERLMFPAPLDGRYHPKMPTLGVRLPDGASRAYPAAELVRAGGAVDEDFEGRSLQVRYDPDAQVFDVEAPPEIEVVESYWFAWAAFHPEASVFTWALNEELEPPTARRAAGPGVEEDGQ
jgi:hypothetical protein